MYQYHRLIAAFESTIDRSIINLAIRQAVGSDDGPRGCIVLDAIEGRHTVIGPAQCIMFLIGNLANRGEDGLIFVKPESC